MLRTALDLERSGEPRSLTETVAWVCATEDVLAAFEMLDLATESTLQVVLDCGDVE